MVAIGLTQPLPGLMDCLTDTARSVGLYGEVYLSNTLEKRGLRVSTSHKAGDLTVINPDGELVHVEVKTARQDKKGTGNSAYSRQSILTSDTPTWSCCFAFSERATLCRSLSRALNSTRLASLSNRTRNTTGASMPATGNQFAR